MDTFVSFYITLMPVILAGVFTMLFCSLPILNCLKKPIDGGRCLKDKERVFGDNKTFKGLVGYILMNAMFAVLWGEICRYFSYLTNHNFLYFSHQNSFLYNLLVGVLFGLAYALFELPNSFFKRRMKIVPGKAPKGWQRVFFVFLDQADSLFGCVLVVCMFYQMSIGLYFCYVLVGAGTHILLNMMLYFLHLRKNLL